MDSRRRRHDDYSSAAGISTDFTGKFYRVERSCNNQHASTSGQRIMTKGRSAEGADFHRERCNVTPRVNIPKRHLDRFRRFFRVHPFTWTCKILCFTMLFNGPDNPKICFFPLGIWAPIWHMVHCAHPSQPPNSISIGSTVFARLTNVTNRHRPTDRPRYSVCSNRPHLASAATRIWGSDAQ